MKTCGFTSTSAQDGVPPPLRAEIPSRITLTQSKRHNIFIQMLTLPTSDNTRLTSNAAISTNFMIRNQHCHSCRCKTTMPSMKHLFFIAFYLPLSGCQSYFGPESLRNTHPSYNQAISDSLNGEMLLNLVRLKYRDEIYFLTVGSVTSSLSLNTTLGANVSLASPTGITTATPTTQIGYIQNPTIQYLPLTGENFFKSIMTPIPLDSLLVLVRNGWNFERILTMCVERINDLYNPPTSAVSDDPDAKKFRRMASLFRILQTSHSIEIGREKNKNDLIILFKPNSQNKEYIHELQSILGFTADEKIQTKAIINDEFIGGDHNEIRIQTRAISNVMHYLAQTVESPDEHINAGLVIGAKENFSVKTDEKEEKTGNLNKEASNLFNVKVSSSYPSNAFIAVPYRDNWFYIRDNDLPSKSSFQLLSNLFELQAGQTKSTAPLLTIPVSH
jgi:hypothetical protein